MHWTGKLLFGFILLAGLHGIANPTPQANAATIPTVHAVADELGYRLAVDPRVTYPPSQLYCWRDAKTSHYVWLCMSSDFTTSKKGRVQRDTEWGVRLENVKPLDITYDRLMTDWSWTRFRVPHLVA